MLIDRAGRALVGRRADIAGPAWQMPQGGIDPGEEPRHAALRELREEIGTDRAEIIAESDGWLAYDLPAEMQGRWGARFRGQTQKWFLARFTGTDRDIDVEGEHREFDDWRWMPIDELTRQIVGFKRDVYRAVVDEFRALVADGERDGEAR
jgi:putative (di)nucleoside polyphosphate hydrolase